MLAKEAKNFFGLMAYGCSNEFWQGKKFQAGISPDSMKFRLYMKTENSFMDFARLIRNKYRSAWQMSNKPEAYAKEIAYSMYITELNGDNSFDPNLRFSLWDDKDALYRTVHEFLPYADILKLSDEELEFITGEKDIKNALPSLFAYGCKCIVYTQGKDGATLYRRNDSISAKGHQVHVVDTTGAGDSCLFQNLLSTLSRKVYR